MLASAVIEEIEGEDAWNFEAETWGIPETVKAGRWVHHDGIRAAKRILGPFETCYTCRLEFTDPKISPDTPELLIEFFPGESTRSKWTTWFIGFENFAFNRDTGCREVDVYVLSTRDVPHLTDIPNTRIRLRYRYFILNEIPVPDWIKEHM